MSSKKYSLANPKIAHTQERVHCSMLFVDSYVAAIDRQPNLNIKQFPNMMKHLEKARQHGKYWREVVVNNLLKEDAKIIDYANDFTSFCQDLLKFAEHIDRPEDRKKFIEALKYLMAQVHEKVQAAQNVADDLEKFHGELSADFRGFETEVNEITKKIIQLNADIKQKEVKIKEYQNNIREDKLKITRDLKLVRDGEIIMGVGAVCVWVFLAGLILTLIEEEKIKEAYHDMIENMVKLEKLDLDVDEETRAVAQLTQLKHQTEGFVKALPIVLEYVNVLQREWSSLHDDLGVVLKALENSEGKTLPFMVTDIVKSAEKDWQVSLDLAIKIQTAYGNVKTKEYKHLVAAFQNGGKAE